jgi:hypothetical protein
MTSFVTLALAAIAAFTILTATAIVMTTKERMHTRHHDDQLALYREGMAANRSNVREALRHLADD